MIRRIVSLIEEEEAPSMYILAYIYIHMKVVAEYRFTYFIKSPGGKFEVL